MDIILSKPDPDICEWWDWQQPCGRIVRICYRKRFATKSEEIRMLKSGKEITVCKVLNYPWESMGMAYSQETIDKIGGHFTPVPLSEF